MINILSNIKCPSCNTPCAIRTTFCDYSCTCGKFTIFVSEKGRLYEVAIDKIIFVINYYIESCNYTFSIFGNETLINEIKSLSYQDCIDLTIKYIENLYLI